MENQFKSFPPAVVEILRQIPDRGFITNIPDGKRMTSVSSLFFRQVMDAAFGCNGWEVRVEKRELTPTFCWKNKKDKSGQIISKEESVLYVATCIGRLVIQKYEFVSAEMMGVDDGDNAAYAIRGAATNLMKTLCVASFGVAASERKGYYPPNYYIAQSANGAEENPPYPFDEPQKPIVPSVPSSDKAPEKPTVLTETTDPKSEDKDGKPNANKRVIDSINRRLSAAKTLEAIDDLRNKSLKAYSFDKEQQKELKAAFTEARLQTVRSEIKVAKTLEVLQKLEDYINYNLSDYKDELLVLTMEATEMHSGIIPLTA